MSDITKPAILLDTLTISHCLVCGVGYVIGWFDWVVEGGKLIDGTKPRRLYMEVTFCETCDKRSMWLFGEDDMRKMVCAWVGNIPDILRFDDDWAQVDRATLKCPFSWFENHFKFFLLDSSGLEPATREEISRFDVIEQWFEVSRYMFGIEAERHLYI